MEATPENGEKPDPTSNVLALVEAAVTRLDDLRETTNQRLDAEIGHVKELSDLRAAHASEIRALESERLDKIREVDMLARNTATDRASEAIAALAQTTAQNAENIRNTVTTTADAIAKQTNNTVIAITDRIAALEKSQYESLGRQAVSDPALGELAAQVKALVASQASGRGREAGVSMTVAVIIGGVGFAVSVVSLVAFFMK
jgi:rubrerythrin